MLERRRLRVRAGVLLVASLAAAMAAATCVAELRALDYSRASLEFVDPDAVEAGAPLAPVGGLSWSTEPYEAAPELEPFRAFMRRECAQTRDHDVVACLVRAMSSRFPHANPRVEFFDAGYEPAAALAAHFGGQPGHCVTRSGLASTALLAMGIPARVVQLFPRSGPGHNVFSYFDRAEQRWVLVDPTYGVVLHQHGTTIASAIHARDVEFDRLSDAPAGLSADVATVYAGQALLDGHALYPEPWLYTRVGPRVAEFPYTGHYVVIGQPTFALGWGHRLFGGGAVVLMLTSMALAVASAAALRRRPRSSLPNHVGDPVSSVVLEVAASRTESKA